MLALLLSWLLVGGGPWLVFSDMHTETVTPTSCQIHGIMRDVYAGIGYIDEDETRTIVHCEAWSSTQLYAKKRIVSLTPTCAFVFDPYVGGASAVGTCVFVR